MHISVRISIYLAVFAGLFFLYVRYLESKSIFFPSKVIEAIPSEFNLAFDDVYLLTADSVKIHGWFIPYDGAKYTLLFCHGNGGNISNRFDKIFFFRQLKLNILIIDYHGYGKSSGKPSESAIYLDAKAALEYLTEQRNISLSNIILYGESLGAAAVIDVASKVNPAALIVEGAFSSGRDMGKILYPYFPDFVFPNIFDSIRKVKEVKAPILFIHSRDDEVIPFGLAKKLYNAVSGPKQFVEISGAHNDSVIVSKEKCLAEINKFIRELKKQ